MSTVTVDIEPFDMGAITKGYPCILVIGRRGTGKSVLLKDILFHYHQFGIKRLVVFSETESVNGYFSEFVPPIFVHSPVTVDAIDRVWLSQQKLCMKKKAGKIPASQDTRLVVILDDLAFNKKIMNCKSLLEIMFNGRHSETIIIVTIQYVMALLPALRSNFDCVMLFKENTLQNRKRAYDNFAGFVPALTTFNAILDAATENYGCLVVYNRSSSTALSDNMFHYRANAGLDFRFGPASAWEYNKKHYESPLEKMLREEEKYKHKEEDSERFITMPSASSKNATIIVNKK